MYQSTGPDGGLWFRGDTWEWDGKAWTQREEEGPAARITASMAFDNIKNRIVLFGGQIHANTVADDTWEWNGTTWTQVADTGPVARADAAMTSTGGALLLHGGMLANGAPFGDTWQWSSGVWSKMQDFGPAPRHGHAMTYDSDRRSVTLFGGQQDPSPKLFGDTWEATEM